MKNAQYFFMSVAITCSFFDFGQAMNMLDVKKFVKEMSCVDKLKLNKMVDAEIFECKKRIVAEKRVIKNHKKFLSESQKEVRDGMEHIPLSEAVGNCCDDVLKKMMENDLLSRDNANRYKEILANNVFTENVISGIEKRMNIFFEEKFLEAKDLEKDLIKCASFETKKIIGARGILEKQFYDDIQEFDFHIGVNFGSDLSVSTMANDALKKVVIKEICFLLVRAWEELRKSTDLLVKDESFEDCREGLDLIKKIPVVSSLFLQYGAAFILFFCKENQTQESIPEILGEQTKMVCNLMKILNDVCSKKNKNGKGLKAHRFVFCLQNVEVFRREFKKEYTSFYGGLKMFMKNFEGDEINLKAFVQRYRDDRSLIAAILPFLVLQAFEF